MKKTIAILMAAVMLLTLAACGGGNEEAAAAHQAELDMLNTQIGALSSQVGTLTQELEEVSALRTLQVLNGTVDGKTSLEFSGEASFTATAALAEGQIVDHWTLNGEAQENSASETFEFTANADTVVAAVVREEKKLVTVNAEIRFLDADGKPTGESLTEFVFENEYVNPVTGETCEGGKISAEIKAVIPGGKMVDYWIVNGVEYYFGTGISAFVVENLDEATTYEVVLKDIPITYYQVTCTNCTFNGRSGGSVPAGTTLTFTSRYTSEFYVNGVMVNDYVSSITIQINSDTYVAAYAIIN